MNEGLHLVSQKLLSPPIHGSIVQRPRLTQRISESEANIVSVVAPAGFGKTVLLSQLAETLNQPVVWYQMDRYDNDPAVFWRYLIAAFQRLNSAFGREALFFVDSNQAWLDRGRTVLSILMNELNRCRQKVTLIFDDCQAVSEADVRMFTEDLLYRVPPWIKVTMASRTDVFQLSRLQTQGRAIRYGTEDLYFTFEDIAGYYAINGIELTRGELEAVATRTACWPLAVSMFLNSTLEGRTSISDTDMDGLFGGQEQNLPLSRVVSGFAAGATRRRKV